LIALLLWPLVFVRQTLAQVPWVLCGKGYPLFWFVTLSDISVSYSAILPGTILFRRACEKMPPLILTRHH
jgi:hypothetical protein